MRVVFLVVAVIALAVPQRARAETCTPTIELAGERALTDAAVPLLVARDLVVVTGERTTPCRRVIVALGTANDRVVLAVMDADGRRAQRVVDDLASAVTVIESWARHDLTDPLLAEPVPTAGLKAPTTPVAAELDRRWVPATPASRRFLLAAGPNTGLSGDGALWIAGRVRGCVSIGRLCIGGGVRYGYDAETGGDAKRLKSSRTMLDLAGIGELPLEVAGLTIAPAIEIGQGSVTARRDKEQEEATAVHIGGGVAVSRRVAAAWALRLDLAIAYAPTARTLLGDVDQPDDQHLAASPRVQSWLGLSLVFYGR